MNSVVEAVITPGGYTVVGAELQVQQRFTRKL